MFSPVFSVIFFLLSFPLLCYMLHSQAFSVQMFTFSIRSVFNLATFIPVCFFSLELVAFCTLPLFAFMLTQYIYVILCMATTKKFLKLIVDCFFVYTYSLYLRRINSSLGSTVKNLKRFFVRVKEPEKIFFTKPKKLLMFDYGSLKSQKTMENSNFIAPKPTLHPFPIKFVWY